MPVKVRVMSALVIEEVDMRLAVAQRFSCKCDDRIMRLSL